MSDFEDNETLNEATDRALAIMGEDDDRDEAETGSHEETTARQADDEGLPEEAVTQEQDDGIDPPEEAVIDSPSSWRHEAKELFSKLPAELQREVAEREAEQQRTFNRVVNEAAQAKQKAEADAARVGEDQQRYQAAIAALAQMSQFYDPILADAKKTDWDALNRDNPAEFVRKQHEVQKHVSMLQNVASEQQRLQAEQAERFTQQQSQQLAQKLPEWNDSSKRSELNRRIQDTLVRDYKFSPDELKQLVDHRTYLVALDAMRYREMMGAQKSASQKRAVTAPRVQKTTPGRDGKQEANKRTDALKQRAIRTGREADAVDAVLAAIGE